MYINEKYIIKGNEIKKVLNETIEFMTEYDYDDIQYYKKENENIIKECGNCDYVLLGERAMDNYFRVELVVNDKETAQELAIEIQSLMSECSISYSELADIQAILQELATKYDLEQELIENGLL